MDVFVLIMSFLLIPLVAYVWIRSIEEREKSEEMWRKIRNEHRVDKEEWIPIQYHNTRAGEWID